MIILGLTGPAGSGKSTLANYLYEQHGYIELSFADPLKDMVAALLGITRVEFDAMALDREWKEATLNDIGASPRHLMQTLGTEWGRQCISADFWVHIAAMRVDDYIHSPGVVFSDVRFENEAKFVRERGQLLHIARDDAPAVSEHISEAGVKMHYRDHLILNDSLDMLYRQADNWIHELEFGGKAA